MAPSSASSLNPDRNQGESFAAAAFNTLSTDPSKLDRLFRNVQAHHITEQLSHLNVTANWVVADPGSDGPPQIIRIDPISSASASASATARTVNGESGVRGRLMGTYPRKTLTTSMSVSKKDDKDKERGEGMLSSGSGSPGISMVGGASITAIEDDEIIPGCAGTTTASKKNKKRNKKKKKNSSSSMKSISESTGSGSASSGTIIGIMEEEEEEAERAGGDAEEEEDSVEIEIELGRAESHVEGTFDRHSVSRQPIDVDSIHVTLPLSHTTFRHRDLPPHQVLPLQPDSSIVQTYIPPPSFIPSFEQTLSLPQDDKSTSPVTQPATQKGSLHIRNSSTSTAEDDPMLFITPSLPSSIMPDDTIHLSDNSPARSVAPIIISGPTPPDSPEPHDESAPQPLAFITVLNPNNQERPPTPPDDSQIPTITFDDPTSPPAHANVHPLSKAWTMYFSDTSSGASSRHQRKLSPLNPLSGQPQSPLQTQSQAQTQGPPSATDYSSNLVTVFSADNLEDFFGGWKALRRNIALSKGRVIEPLGDSSMRGGMGLGTHLYPEDSNFHIFVQGVKPMWEDVMCQKGGKIMIAGDAAAMDNLFFEISMLLISGELDSTLPYPRNDNVGIVGAVLSRRKLTRIEIWIGGEVAPDGDWIKALTGVLSRKYGGPIGKVYGFKPFGMA